MTLEDALQWADTFGPIQSLPLDGDGPALMVLAAEVRRLRTVEADAELVREVFENRSCGCQNQSLRDAIRGANK